MRTIAMYLPQFHSVKENDEWWGEGFTDWKACSEAEALFDNHYQPHVPLNENYYDLLQKETMQWQANLMKEYAVDGICMYHYYFKDGAKILEKPAENLLQWTDINMPYCFCWANVTWARSWSKIKNKTSWTTKMESQRNPDEKEVLMLQEYGAEEDWIRHFEYLLPFFKDSRYICVDEKPVFLIYVPEDIKCIDEMLACWRRLAMENGLKGLHLVKVLGQKQYSCFDAELIHAPAAIFGKYSRNNWINSINVMDYDGLWKRILEQPLREGKKIYYGGFVGYDDTPRQGGRGNVVVDCTPKRFGKYLPQLMAKNEVAGNDITFINAWNEWGEGMHLEPDERYGNQFLEQIPLAKATYSDHLERMAQGNRELSITIEEYQKMNIQKEKLQLNISILDIWMMLLENRVSISEYLLQRGYKKVVIYGYAVLGRHLLAELQKSPIQILGIVDKLKDRVGIDNTVPSYLPTDTLPECDAVIVTVPYYEDEIREVMKSKGMKCVLSLREMIDELSEVKLRES